jgi:hypothetical protein
LLRFCSCKLLREEERRKEIREKKMKEKKKKEKKEKCGNNFKLENFWGEK